MKIKELDKRPTIGQIKKLRIKYVYFEKLINELREREMPLETVKSVNLNIDQINSFSGSDKELLKHIRKWQYNILKLIEKELNLVPKNLYRGRWMAIGMAVFGIPLGVVLGVSLDNMGLLATGIPIGMVVGIAVGAGMDKKAFEEGRQLDLEIKY